MDLVGVAILIAVLEVWMYENRKKEEKASCGGSYLDVGSGVEH